MNAPMLTFSLKHEHDAVLARQRTLQMASLLNLAHQDQTRMATAVSELARNVLRYTPGGRVEYFLADDSEVLFMARISDTGKGIPHLQAVLDGQYVSQSGLGLGIIGTKRLVEVFDVQTSEKGTVFTIGKIVPKPAVSIQKLAAEVTAKLAQTTTIGLMEAIERQNQELLMTLSELLSRQSDIDRINRELAETNRGVVALYAELDEKNKTLKAMSELKSRFLSAISHELRTPLSSIRSMSRLLLDQTDGDLNAEQAKQVGYIRSTAEGLTEMVNDLLDLAKIEAGKIDVKPQTVEVEEIFAGLRGMFRPMLEAKPVTLTFELDPAIRAMNSDVGKVTQVLRNLISNAIKFTLHGAVTVSAVPDGQHVKFSVKDTGIGIAPEDQERIFMEYVQVDSPLQRNLKGTGLGLSLSRKIATLLGGELTVVSNVGQGSIFTFRIPLIYSDTHPSEGSDMPGAIPQMEAPRV